jgi:hypothetical protein
VDLVPGPLHLRKSSSAGNRTQTSAKHISHKFNSNSGCFHAMLKELETLTSVIVEYVDVKVFDLFVYNTSYPLISEAESVKHL